MDWNLSVDTLIALVSFGLLIGGGILAKVWVAATKITSIDDSIQIISKRIDNVEQRTAVKLDNISNKLSDHGERLTRIETKIEPGSKVRT